MRTIAPTLAVAAALLCLAAPAYAAERLPYPNDEACDVAGRIAQMAMSAQQFDGGEDVFARILADADDPDRPVNADAKRLFETIVRGSQAYPRFDAPEQQNAMIVRYVMTVRDGCQQAFWPDVR